MNIGVVDTREWAVMLIRVVGSRVANGRWITVACWGYSLGPIEVQGSPHDTGPKKDEGCRECPHQPQHFGNDLERTGQLSTLSVRQEKERIRLSTLNLRGTLW
jgi:hypothetical protein